MKIFVFQRQRRPARKAPVLPTAEPKRCCVAADMMMDLRRFLEVSMVGDVLRCEGWPPKVNSVPKKFCLCQRHLKPKANSERYSRTDRQLVGTIVAGQEQSQVPV